LEKVSASDRDFFYFVQGTGRRTIVVVDELHLAGCCDVIGTRRVLMALFRVCKTLFFNGSAKMNRDCSFRGNAEKKTMSI